MSAACAADGCTNQAALVQRELGKAFCSQRCISDYRCDTHQYLKASPTTYAVPIGSPLVAVVKGSLAAAGASPDAVMKSKLHSGGAHYLLPVAHVDALIEQLKAIGPLKRGLDGDDGDAPNESEAKRLQREHLERQLNELRETKALQYRQGGTPDPAASVVVTSSSSSLSSTAPASLPGGMDADMLLETKTDAHTRYMRTLGDLVARNPVILTELMKHSDTKTMRALGSINWEAYHMFKASDHKKKMTVLSKWLLSLPVTIPEYGDMKYLYTIKQWSLDSKYIQTLPPEIGVLGDLGATYLWLGNNQLKSLPSEIGDIASLVLLDINSNRLASLPAEIGKLTSLETLDLSWNRLKVLPPEIGNLSSLKDLNLEANQLTSLPPEIGKLSSLKMLNVNLNDDLEYLPSSVLKIPNLTIINRRGVSMAVADLVNATVGYNVYIG